MKYHFAAPIDKLLDAIATKKPEYIPNKYLYRVYDRLERAKREGKIVYTGCDNMDKNGYCAGHDD